MNGKDCSQQAHALITVLRVSIRLVKRSQLPKNRNRSSQFQENRKKLLVVFYDARFAKLQNQRTNLLARPTKKSF